MLRELTIRHKLAAAVALLGALAISIGLGRTLAAFSSESSNPGNSFAASASFGFQMETGVYSGDGTDDRPITVGFQPDVVIVKSSANSEAHIRTTGMPADQDKVMTGTSTLVSQSNRLQSLSATGFVVGSNADVNSASRDYYWTALKATTGKLAVGSYTGNGAASRDIPVGFNPLIEFLMSADSDRAVFRTDAFSNSYRFDTRAASDALIGETASSFTVGSAAEANSSGTTYYYVAIGSVSGQSATGSYTGDSTTGRVIATGFQPDFAVTKRESNNNPAWRAAPLTGTNSLRFSNSAPQSNRMTAITPSGFEVGGNGDVNTGGQTYGWFALKKR